MSNDEIFFVFQIRSDYEVRHSDHIQMRVNTRKDERKADFWCVRESFSRKIHFHLPVGECGKWNEHAERSHRLFLPFLSSYQHFY